MFLGRRGRSRDVQQPSGRTLFLLLGVEGHPRTRFVRRRFRRYRTVSSTRSTLEVLIPCLDVEIVARQKKWKLMSLVLTFKTTSSSAMRCSVGAAWVMHMVCGISADRTSFGVL